MNNSTILIAGSIAVDTIETPKTRKENVLGGSVTYALVAANRFSKCHIVGIVGTDFPAEGNELYGHLASNLDDVQKVDGKTFSWGGRYSENWDDRSTLFTELGVFADFSPKLSEVNQSCDAILLANIHPELQLSVIEQSKTRKLIVLDTMNLWIDTTRNQLNNVISKASVLLINESEAGMLSGISDPIDAGKVLLKDNLVMVVIKLGSKGAVVIKKDERLSIGAYPVKEVIDPTGAGDTFAGAFTGVLASGGTELDALIKASALASVCVEGFGVEKLLTLTDDEIVQRSSYLKQTVEL